MKNLFLYLRCISGDKAGAVYLGQVGPFSPETTVSDSPGLFIYYKCQRSFLWLLEREYLILALSFLKKKINDKAIIIPGKGECLPLILEMLCYL